MKQKFNTNVILCYNSMNRYKLVFNNQKQVAELYDLDNGSIWERFDYFEFKDKSKEEIINKSKELIEVWKSESVGDFHHMTELN